MPHKPTLHQELMERFPGLRYEISDDFVGVFDGIFSEAFCKGMIDYFETMDKVSGTYTRVQGFDKKAHVVDDSAIDFNGADFYTNDSLKVISPEFVGVFWQVGYQLYKERYSILDSYEKHQIYTIKLQKSKPGQGYHVWHSEDMTRMHANRVLVFILYLNDIDEGGETEFLYLKKRIKPEAGRLVIWPAGFTHTHRGNPPLGDTDKYIITGWVEL